MRTGPVLLLFVSCVTTPSPKPAEATPPAPTESQLLQKKMSGLVAETAAVMKARDAALWSYWLGGAATGLEQSWAGHEALLTDESLLAIRRARELKAFDPQLLDGLETVAVSERVGRAAREAEAAVANLEASARFTFEGREVLLRDLAMMLATEHNAPRRVSMWEASIPAAQHVAAAAAHRDEVATAALATMQLTPVGFATLLRGVDLDAAGQWADRFLTATDARWKARLSRSSATSRADIPAMLHASATLDGAFPKSKEAERATALLAGSGLYGVAGMTLDLNESPRKQPLPLTVAPAGAQDVRLSFRPRGGYKDQQLLLAEIGRALATHYASPSVLPMRRRCVEATAALFGALATDKTWLEDQGLAAPLVTAATELGLDLRLSATRTAAGELLVGLVDPPAVAQYARAKGFGPSVDDEARWRLEDEPSFASVEVLRAQSAAAALQRYLEVETGPKWWTSPKAGDLLREYWKTDELPEPVRAFAEDGESLLAALGAPAHGGVGVPFSSAVASMPATTPAPAPDAGVSPAALP